MDAENFAPCAHMRARIPAAPRQTCSPPCTPEVRGSECFERQRMENFDQDSSRQNLGICIQSKSKFFGHFMNSISCPPAIEMNFRHGSMWIHNNQRLTEEITCGILFLDRCTWNNGLLIWRLYSVHEIEKSGDCQAVEIHFCWRMAMHSLTTCSDKSHSSDGWSENVCLQWTIVNRTFIQTWASRRR